MPDNPDSGPKVERFTAGGGRYACTLSVQPDPKGGVTASLTVSDLVSDPMTDEITLECERVGTKRDVANWLANEALEDALSNKRLSAKISDRIHAFKGVFEKLVNQLTGRHEPVETPKSTWDRDRDVM